MIKIEQLDEAGSAFRVGLSADVYELLAKTADGKGITFEAQFTEVLERELNKMLLRSASLGKTC